MKRRLAREYILQMLFQHDFTSRQTPELIAEFWKDRPEAEEPVRRFATEIFIGTVDNIEHIDDIIRQTAENWVLERMAIVDRNILRFACYELLFRKDIPPIVSINEAIEIAKKYSTQESSSFINGILDKIARKYKKASKG